MPQFAKLELVIPEFDLAQDLIFKRTNAVLHQIRTLHQNKILY